MTTLMLGPAQSRNGTRGGTKVDAGHGAAQVVRDAIEALEHGDESGLRLALDVKAVEQDAGAGYILRGSCRIADALMAFRGLFPEVDARIRDVAERSGQVEADIFWLGPVQDMDGTGPARDPEAEDHLVVDIRNGKIVAIRHRHPMNVLSATA